MWNNHKLQKPHQQKKDNIKMLDDEQLRRVTEPKRSNSARMAWKKYGANYRKGIRKRLRHHYGRSEDSMKDIINTLKEVLQEAEIKQNNVFDNEAQILFDNMPGGISLDIDKNTGTISLTTKVGETEQPGSYKSQNNLSEDELDALFKQIVEELHDLCTSFDEELKQLLDRHGLLPTK